MVVFAAAPLLWLGAKSLEANSTSATLAANMPVNVETNRSFLKTPSFWFLATAFMFSAMVHGVILHHFLSILKSRGITDEVAVLAASFIGPMQVAGRLALFACGRHITNHNIAQFCFVAFGVSVVILYWAGATISLLVIFVILFAGAHGIASVIRPVIAWDLLGQRYFGAKSGALAMLFLSGSAVSPYIGAVLWRAGGYDFVLLCLTGFAVCGYTLYRMAHRFADQNPD